MTPTIQRITFSPETSILIEAFFILFSFWYCLFVHFILFPSAPIFIRGNATLHVQADGRPTSRTIKRPICNALYTIPWLGEFQTGPREPRDIEEDIQKLQAAAVMRTCTYNGCNQSDVSQLHWRPMRRCLISIQA